MEIIMNKFHLEIVTPDKHFFEDDVLMVIIRTTEGDIGILKDHEPIVTPVSVGELKIKLENNEEKIAACAGGFLTIDEDRVIVITDSAEWGEEIDIKRAEEAEKRAKERLESKYEDIDFLRAKIALKKAANRINIYKKSSYKG